MSSAPGRIAIAFGGAAFAIYALSASSYELRVLALAGCQVVLVLGYQLIFGHLGAISLAQGAFFGLGAYVTAILDTRYGVGFAASFPLSILLPVAVAGLVAIPVLRLASHYFALATLGLAQVVLLAFVNGGDTTGGALGVAGIPGISLLGWSISGGLPLAVLVWAVATLAAVLAARLTHGFNRLAFAMERGDPLAAAAIGIDGARLRFGAFLLSAAYAGAAGALEAHVAGVVSPETLGFAVMVTCLAMTVIGGSTRITGAFLGALLLTYLPEKLRFLEGNALLAYGAAMLATVILAPEGLAGLPKQAALHRFLSARPRAPRPSTTLVRNTGVAGARQDEPADDDLAPERSGSSDRTQTLLEARGLARRFGGIEAISGVDFDVAAGEILGLIGPNGSGKTTLANIVTGLIKPDRGVIFLRGRPIEGTSAHRIARLGIARSFQTPSLPAEATALEAVALAGASRSGSLGFAAALRGADRGRDRQRLEAEANALLDRLGLAAIASRLCGELEPASARRLEIARALALRPSLVILDEPAAGLTGPQQAALAAALRGLASEGLALIVIEHNMPFLLGLADRLLALDAGRVIAEGTPAEVRRDPSVIAAYLGSAPA